MLAHRLTFGLIALLLLISSNSFALTLQSKVHGLPKVLADNVTARLKAEQENLDDLTAEKLIQYYDEAPTFIKDALSPYGYFKPEIKKRLLRRGDNYTADFTINPGPVLTISRLNIHAYGQGATAKPILEVLDNIQLKHGGPFSSVAYEEAKDDLLSAALSHGFLDAKFVQSEVLIDLKAYQAQVILHLDTGPIYYFGEISFSASTYSEDFLQRFPNFKAGEPYNETKLQSLQEDLNDTGLFKQVIVIPQKNRAKNRVVPIRVSLLAQSPRTFTVGAGYGTDTGFRGLLGAVFRRFTANGQQLRALLRISERLSNFEATYIIPGKKPASSRYEITGKVEYENIDSGDSLSQNISGSYISQIHDWQQTLSLTFLNENYTLRDQDRENSTMLIPNAKWLLTVSDNPIRPMRGYSVNFYAQGTHQILGSSKSFFQVYAHGKGITTLFNNRSMLLARATFGYTATKDLKQLPLSIQLLAGGSQSIRGYDYKSIGPGRFLTVASLEYRLRVYGNWYLAGFYDIGSADRQIFGSFKRGPGVGIVWLSPIGAVELTAAKSLDTPSQPWKIQFSVGPDL